MDEGGRIMTLHIHRNGSAKADVKVPQGLTSFITFSKLCRNDIFPVDRTVSVHLVQESNFGDSVNMRPL